MSASFAFLSRYLTEIGRNVVRQGRSKPFDINPR